MKSWKTTLTGVLSILVAVGSAAMAWLKTGVFPDLGPVVAAVTAGVGLIVARDNDKTSEAVGAAPAGK
jgi:hypothetical protein